MKKTLLINLFLIFIIQVYSQNVNEIYKALPIPYNETSNLEFGSSVAVDGNYAVVGACGYRKYQGCAYVFYKNGSDWEQVAKLTASDTDYSQRFGYDVDISGDNIIVGVKSSSSSTVNKVYLFTRPQSGWTDMTETAKLTASDYDLYDKFGYSLSISDDIIAIGACDHKVNGIEKGAAYVFKKPESGWIDMTETAILTASDGASGDKFSYSIAVSGDNIVVGAYEVDQNGERSGAAYVFTKPDGGWEDMTETAKLVSSHINEYDSFGFGVDIDGDNIVVGAIGKEYGTDILGSAYVFTKPDDGWEDMTETAILLGSDLGSHDDFGRNVSISGNNIVVSAQHDDDNGVWSGSAYVFSMPVSGWENMTEVSKLTASDGAISDSFGYDVDIAGDNIIIGAYKNNGTEVNSGSVYSYSKPTGGWTEISVEQKLNAEIVESFYEGYYGSSVAIDGDYAVIGATGYKGSKGCAYVLHNTGTAWETQAILTSSNGESNDHYGSAVSISGNTIVVGNYHKERSSSLMAGLVYVYVKPETGWEDMTQTAMLMASDYTSYDYFGKSVSISGDYIVVGATGDDDNGNQSGSAYLFKKSDVGWSNMIQTAKLKPSDGSDSDHFGQSVSISGDYIVVGSPDDDDNGDQSGSAYIFKKPTDGWKNMTQTAKLIISQGSRYDNFGEVVSIFEDNVAVGVKGFNNISNDEGAVCIFTKPESGWTDMTETAILTASDAYVVDNLGYCVSISDNYVVAGSYGDDDNGNGSGAAYFYSKPEDGWVNMTETVKLTASDGTSNDRLGCTIAISDNNIISGAKFDDVFGKYSGSAYFFRRIPVELSIHPQDQLNVSSGSVVSFNVSAENAQQYQWQVSSDNGQIFTDIEDNEVYSNSTSPTLSVLTSENLNNNLFRCVVSNGWTEIISDAATLTVVETTGINDQKESQINIYPNPVSDILYYTTNEDKPVLIQIFDLTGKLMRTKKATEKEGTINISELNKGIYLVKININNDISTYKIIKE